MKGKVLIIDDESDMVSMMKMTLEAYGLEVITASNGEEALSVYDPSVKLVISDMQMLKMTGLEFLTNAEAKYGSINIIFTSGNPNSEILKVGGKEYQHFSKPIFEMDKFLAAIDSYLTLPKEEMTTIK
jgi:CheY-like chemotaxis protein